MKCVLVPGVLEETLRLVRSYGTAHRPHEGVVLWGGVESNGKKLVTTIMAPRARTGPGFFRIPPQEALRVGLAWQSAGVRYLAQVHSHPPLCTNDHSYGDDKDAYLKFEGLISVVVSDYGSQDSSLIPIESAGVHLFSAGKFKRLEPEEVRSMFEHSSTGSVRVVDLREK